MNPLSLPWGKKPPSQPELPPVPNYLGARNETKKDFAQTSSEQFITITVRGVKGQQDGDYKLPWTEGNQLKLYLRQVNLTMAAIKSALRDSANPGQGRIRLSYIPAAGAQITLGNTQVSSALQFQRSNHNAERVANGMGGGAKDVEFKLSR